MRATVWRFRTLRRADRVFSGVEAGKILDRRLFGHRIWLDVTRSSVQKLLYLEGERFISERELVSSLLRRGMTVVDVGANIGYYLLLFQRFVGCRGTIICLEPDEANLRELSRQIVGNAFTNVVVFPVAAGAQDGTASLQPGINARVRGHGPGARMVGLCRLDSVLGGPVDVLKIDVEGYEGHVLDGAREVLRRWRPSVFVEVHPQLIEAPYSVEGILETVTRLRGGVEVYSAPHGGSALAKVRARYSGNGGVRRSEVSELVRACQAGTQRAPFWVVSRAA